MSASPLSTTIHSDPRAFVDQAEAYKKQYRYLRFMCRETLDHLAFVNGKVKDVEGFWLSTLVRLRCCSEMQERRADCQLKHSQLGNYLSSRSDKEALKYLTQIELVQDPKDPRPFSLKFVSVLNMICRVLDRD